MTIKSDTSLKPLTSAVVSAEELVSSGAESANQCRDCIDAWIDVRSLLPEVRDVFKAGDSEVRDAWSDVKPLQSHLEKVRFTARDHRRFRFHPRRLRFHCILAGLRFLIAVRLIRNTIRNAIVSAFEATLLAGVTTGQFIANGTRCVLSRLHWILLVTALVWLAVQSLLRVVR